MKRGKIIFLVVILLIPAISASDVLVWQGQYYTGTTFNTGNYEFNFSVYDSLTGGEVCYTNTTTLTTGNFGEWITEQIGVNSACNNVSKDYYLNINIDGTDQAPRKRILIWSYLRKDVDEVSTGDLVLHGVVQGLSPLKLQDEINFLKSDGTITSAIYNAPRESTSSLSSDFEDSLIHDIINETNDFGMQECFWDENTETMQMCISGAYLPNRATTVSRSFQVVGNTTNKAVNENFTLCEGNNYVDCNADLTGADLLVEDDIESIGSIFSQENITAEYFFSQGIEDLKTIQFNVSDTSYPHSPGKINWNYGEGTIEIGTDVADVITQVGRETITKVVNKEGTTIRNGQAVYISGAQGNRAAVKLARADQISTTLVLGLATHDIENNQEGYVTLKGYVNDLDTSIFSTGDNLYLSATQSGNLTTTPPDFPNFRILIGKILASHNNQGRIEIINTLDYTDGVTLNSLGIITNLTVNQNVQINGNLIVEGCIIYNNSGTPATLGTCI